MKREREFFESLHSEADSDSCGSDDTTAKRLRLEVTSTGNKKRDSNMKVCKVFKL